MPLRNQISNYDQVAAYLEGTNLARYLDDQHASIWPSDAEDQAAEKEENARHRLEAKELLVKGMRREEL